MRFDDAHRPWRDTLSEDCIHLVTPGNPGRLDVSDKWTLISSLHRTLCERERIQAGLCSEIEKELIERERLMSTGIGEQMAIPHAVVAEADRFMTECAIIREGIEFESIDNTKAYIVVMLVAPKSALQGHLKVMAEIARVFYRAETRQKVIAAANAAEVLEVVRNAPV
ncbi:MAG TPA: PTS sugar transporter subunit IIA [Turneriella sp.]|nr:PTS sugar transporter subunit IIA [Turneriella sp.]HNA78831.1 PTS sugar transporter subunit IIA [Turneriella sp.]HNE18270.1 PTS sugar transporter subunit IIA [Turneriella sp.]HNJ64551.1 PTS sugar transporter subunit IIA [Turneriella sp.]HNL10251.1 PTS sugar transporter subunit IIA [Turneriella sp.]